jgi:hypothetical protein
MPSNSDAAAARAISRRICVQSGDTVSEVRAFRRGLSRELQAEPARSVIAIAVHLSQAPQPWHRFIAYELILHHPLAPSQIDPRSVVLLGKGMAAWQDVDCFAPYISGPAWRDGRIPTALVHRWAGSKDRWWRRAALVSTVPLNVRSQGGRGPMVVKALSWALRVLSVRDPDAVRVYVASRKGKLPALALREVRNKLETGLKNPRRGGRR